MSTKRRKKLKIHTKITATGQVGGFWVFALVELSCGFGCVCECRDSGDECLTVKRDLFRAGRLLRKKNGESFQVPWYFEVQKSEPELEMKRLGH